jgi:hypothetical protein
MCFTKNIIPLFFLLIGSNLFAQDTAKQQPAAHSLFDSSNNTVKIKDSTKAVVKRDSFSMKPKHDPHKAIVHSALIPGWGQAYNHEYWKIPIVYAAIGIPLITYIYNNTWYHRTNNAFNIYINNDTSNFKNVYPLLQPFQYADGGLQDLQNYRDEFRRDRDYSMVYFFLAWGLNVVDAAVFAHLRDFDVSDDISMNVQPDFNSATKSANLSLVFSLKKPEHKILNFGK